ncbi:MAG: peptidoglycan DD-metalloendopeptidase family protein, partial [Dehalococcoidia bacterium]
MTTKRDSSSDTAAVEPITERQLEVARLVADGRSNPEIADALGISLAGAKYHVSELLGRLGLDRREDVAAWYRERGAAPIADRAPEGRWRRLRALWPLGAVAAAAIPALAIAVALSGGQAGETPAAAPTATAAVAATGVVEPTSVATSMPAGEPPPFAAYEGAPLFYEHEIGPRESLLDLALRFGVQPDHVAWSNPAVPVLSDHLGVTMQDALPSGLEVRVPALPGILHTVRIGDTVYDIANRYSADWRDIVAFPPNGLSVDASGAPGPVEPGAVILVPDGTLPPSAGLRPRPLVEGDRIGFPPDVEGWAWQWPAQGAFKTEDLDDPRAIDIAAAPGTPVYASRDGVVTFAGGDACCDYGLHVIVEHADGYETLYAHLDEIAVAEGDTVAAA